MRVAILLLLPVLGAPVPAAMAADPVACGVRKLASGGRACGDLLRVEARHLEGGDAATRTMRVARIAAGLERRWSAAAAADAGGTCATESADGAQAGARLAAVAAAAAAELPGSAACRAALLDLLAPLCRRAVATERAFLRASDGAPAARARTVARLRDRIAARFPAACAGSASASDAAETLFRVAGIAIGDATTRGLRALGAEADVVIGAAVEPGEVASDPAYPPALARDVSSLTAENTMKWGPIHPQPGLWNFAPADAVVALAESGGQRLRGHTLVWGALQLPAYVESAATAGQLRAVLAEHVATVMGRFAGRVAQWDVVNEPLSGVLDPETPDGLDDNVFRRLLGPGYVAEALHLARAADPTAKLYVNENGVEVPGPRQDRFFALVQELLATGTPLDGIGFQAHLGLVPIGQYPDAATIEASLRRFADLGLEVELTELDVTLVFRPDDVPSRIAFQGDYYRGVVQACARLPACSGVTLWGLSDRYSWLRSFFGFTDWPLPFDDAWQRKPAYFGMRAALATAALRDA